MQNKRVVESNESVKNAWPQRYVQQSARAIGIFFGAVVAVGFAGGCGETIVSNLIWFEATAGSNGEVVSQGPGRPLQLTCGTVGNGVPCQWTVRMRLRNAEALTGWSLSLLGDSSAPLVEVTSFSYDHTEFVTAAGGGAFGPEPNLLTGTGASTAVVGGVVPGNYTLLQFILVYDNPTDGPNERAILAMITDGTLVPLPDPEDQVPPIVQIAGNLPFPTGADAVLPEAVILIDLNGEDDNDDDDDDDDNNRRPRINCPENLTLECDGAGNVVAVNGWLASAEAESFCTGLQVVDDFDELDDSCGAAGTAQVTWRATDSCGSNACSASLVIRDTTPPTVSGPVDLSFQCDIGGPHTALRNWLDSATAVDTCGEVETSMSRGATVLDCSGIVVWTANDECGNAGTDSATVTITGDVGAPTLALIGPAAVTLECGNDEYVESGTTVTDDCDLTLFGPSIGGAIVNSNETGVYIVNYDAVDLCGHAATRLTRTVTVVDTRGPRVELIPVTLWPPNHDYVTMNLSDCARAVDDCEGDLDIDDVGTIVSAKSSEPDNSNGEGNTENDAVVVDDNTFQVRSERRGGGGGRTYTITFDVEDSAGHVARHECFIEVPHDQGGSTGNGDDDEDSDDDDDDDGDDNDNDD